MSETVVRFQCCLASSVSLPVFDLAANVFKGTYPSFGMHEHAYRRSWFSPRTIVGASQFCGQRLHLHAGVAFD